MQEIFTDYLFFLLDFFMELPKHLCMRVGALARMGSVEDSRCQD